MGDIEPLEELLAGVRDLLTGDCRICAGCMSLIDEGCLLLRGHRITGGLQLFVKILELLARVGLMLGEIEGSTRCNSFQFVCAEGELVVDVDAGAGVVGEVGFGLPVVFEDIHAKADRGIVGRSLCDPVAVPHFPAPIRLRFAQVGSFIPCRHGAMDQANCLIGLDEELEFHLLELAGAEGEVFRRHFVTEGLPNLADAEGDLHARGVADILELGKDCLGCFWPQIGDIVRGGRRSDIGAEHQIKRPRLVEYSAGLGMKIHRAVDRIDLFLA